MSMKKFKDKKIGFVVVIVVVVVVIVVVVVGVLLLLLTSMSDFSRAVGGEPPSNNRINGTIYHTDGHHLS